MEDENKILEAYHSGIHSIKGISRKTGYGFKKVAKVLSTAGIVLSDVQEEIIKLRKSGMTTAEIMVATGMSETTVSSYSPKILPEQPMKQSEIGDYAIGIIYATSYVARENGKEYVFARNKDPWPIKFLADISGKNMYISNGTYCVKCKNIPSIPDINAVISKKDFLRAYIELHGVLDLQNTLQGKRLRLRIYGKYDVANYINHNLPAKEKKIQSIKNKIDGGYTGETSAVYYQSQHEIPDILEWLDGEPRNEKVWKKWNKLMAF